MAISIIRHRWSGAPQRSIFNVKLKSVRCVCSCEQQLDMVHSVAAKPVIVSHNQSQLHLLRRISWYDQKLQPSWCGDIVFVSCCFPDWELRKVSVSTNMYIWKKMEKIEKSLCLLHWIFCCSIMFTNQMVKLLLSYEVHYVYYIILIYCRSCGPRR